MNLDALIDHFSAHHALEYSLALLRMLSHPSQGGLGYKLVLKNLLVDIDGFECDHKTRTLTLDERRLFRANTPAEISAFLKDAIDVEFNRTHLSRASALMRGSGKVLLGVVQAGIGLVGIIVPEPGTTAGGVVLVALGANDLADGFAQLAGARGRHGFNAFQKGAGFAGQTVAGWAGGNPQQGKEIGENTFTVASFLAGPAASVKILRVPGKAMVSMGVGGQSGGFELGRLQMLYPSSRAGDGMTIASITNNSGQSILRLVTHGGQMVVNGRIVGVDRVLRHSTNPREILAGLIKLAVHGAKAGW